MKSTAEQLKRLEEAILSDLFHHDGRKKTIIKYLFTAVRNKRKYVESDDIVKDCPGEVDATKPEGAAIKVMSEIKLALQTYFRSPKGQEQKIRFAYAAEGNYLPVFEENTIEDHHNAFWKHYLSNDAILMYPEPFFVIDHKGTYLRNSLVNREEKVEFFSYLDGIDVKEKSPDIENDPQRYTNRLETGYSYVPAGIVQGMFFIVNSLARHSKGAMLDTEPVTPGSIKLPRVGPLIFVTTPTSAKEMVSLLEGPHSLHTTGEGITRDKKLEFEEVENEDGLIKWGLVTRWQQRSRTVTVISAKHGRTVEAIAQYLTDESRIAELAVELEGVEAFDSGFQAVFEVTMGKSPAGPNIDRTRLHEAVALPVVAYGVARH